MIRLLLLLLLPFAAQAETPAEVAVSAPAEGAAPAADAKS